MVKSGTGCEAAVRLPLLWRPRKKPHASSEGGSGRTPPDRSPELGGGWGAALLLETVPVGPGLGATSAPSHPVPSQLEPSRVPSATEAFGGADADGGGGESSL